VLWDDPGICHLEPKLTWRPRLLDASRLNNSQFTGSQAITQAWIFRRLAILFDVPMRAAFFLPPWSA